MKEEIQKVVTELNKEYDHTIKLKKRGTRKYEKKKLEIFINKENTGKYIHVDAVTNLESDLDVYYSEIDSKKETIKSIKQYLTKIIEEYEREES